MRDVRGIFAERPVDVTLVFGRDARIGKTCICHGAVLADLDGRAESHRVLEHGLVVLREGERQFDGRLGDQGCLRVSSTVGDRLPDKVPDVFRRDHRLDAAAAFDVDLVLRHPFIFGSPFMVVHVEDILRRKGVFVHQGVQILHLGRAEVEHQEGVLALAFVFAVEVEDGVVVLAGHVAVG